MDYPPRESLIASAIRAFLKMFFGLMGILIAFFVFAMLYSSVTISTPITIEEKTTLNILNDAEGRREVLPSTTPAILEINLHGKIGDARGTDAQIFRNILNDSRTGHLAGNRVKGILLNFNTPGGTVVDSEAIYEMINEYKARYNVPVYAFVEGLCASGGMYIAASSDKIFAGPSSIIGSIGVVIGPFFNVYETMEKWGVHAKTITEGLDKDTLNPTRPWREGEGASIQAVTAFMYHRFVDIVTKARPRLDKAKLIEDYGAHVFDCVTAEKLGFIDVAMSSRNEALRELLIASKIDSTKSYQVVSLSPKNAWISEFVSSESPLFSGKIKHTLETDKIREQPCFLYE
ncbi:MAG TPA: S49 family peptidase [Chlamydiales bacterium]|nr:S49 family peptidase [Chlamydiales bacterium]